MKLTGKLVSVILLEIVALLAVDGYLAVRREKEMFQSDMQRDASLLGNVLKDVVAETWRAKGSEAAIQLLKKSNREQHMMRARWVWLGLAEDEGFRPLAPAASLAPVAAGNELTLAVTDGRGEKLLCTYIPVDVESPRSGAIELSEPLSQLDVFAYTIIWKNVILAVVLTGMGGASVVLLGVFLVGRPLHRLADKAQQVGQGDLTPSLAVRGHDELSEVSEAMNDMCRQLAAAQEQTRIEQERRITAIEQLRHADRLRTVGRLAAGIAHELGTPLNTISIRSGMIAGGQLSGDEITENARIVKSQCERMTTIIRGLLDYARPRSPQRTPADLRQVARGAIEMVSPLAAKRNVALALHENGSPCNALVDVGQLQQVLTNLLVNALQAEPPARRIEVAVHCGDGEAQSDGPPTSAPAVCITVQDDGGGISDKNLNNIFEPFFTTKDVGDGTGLGLSVAHGIVKEHGGRIEVASQLGAGSRFSVYVPAQTSPPRGTSIANHIS